MVIEIQFLFVYLFFKVYCIICLKKNARLSLLNSEFIPLEMLNLNFKENVRKDERSFIQTDQINCKTSQLS